MTTTVVTTLLTTATVGSHLLLELGDVSIPLGGTSRIFSDDDYTVTIVVTTLLTMASVGSHLLLELGDVDPPRGHQPQLGAVGLQRFGLLGLLRGRQLHPGVLRVEGLEGQHAVGGAERGAAQEGVLANLRAQRDLRTEGGDSSVKSRRP